MGFYESLYSEQIVPGIISKDVTSLYSEKVVSRRFSSTPSNIIMFSMPSAKAPGLAGSVQNGNWILPVGTQEDYLLEEVRMSDAVIVAGYSWPTEDQPRRKTPAPHQVIEGTVYGENNETGSMVDQSNIGIVF